MMVPHYQTDPVRIASCGAPSSGSSFKERPKMDFNDRECQKGILETCHWYFTHCVSSIGMGGLVRLGSYKQTKVSLPSLAWEWLCAHPQELWPVFKWLLWIPPEELPLLAQKQKEERYSWRYICPASAGRVITNESCVIKAATAWLRFGARQVECFVVGN